MNALPAGPRLTRQRFERFNSHQYHQLGFTLIELVCLLSIIGILSAVALPAFQDTSSQALQSKASSIAASLEVASAHNRLALHLGDSNAFLASDSRISFCTATYAAKLLQNLPEGASYRSSSGGLGCGFKVDSLSCQVSFTASDGTLVSAPYKFYCAGNS